MHPVIELFIEHGVDELEKKLKARKDPALTLLLLELAYAIEYRSFIREKRSFDSSIMRKIEVLNSFIYEYSEKKKDNSSGDSVEDLLLPIIPLHVFLILNRNSLLELHNFLKLK